MSFKKDWNWFIRSKFIWYWNWFMTGFFLGYLFSWFVNGFTFPFNIN